MNSNPSKSVVPVGPLCRFCLLILALVAAGPSAETITLEQVIRDASTQSDSAKMMRESAKKTKDMISEKWALALPTVSASIAATRMYQLGAGARRNQSETALPQSMMNEPVTWGALTNMFGALTQPAELPYYTSSLQLQQPLYTFGKIGTAVDVANQFDSSTQSINRRNLQQLQLSALDAFYGVVISDLVLAVSRRSLSRKEELYGHLERNFSLGAGNKAYLLAARAELNGQTADLIGAEQNARNARLALCLFTGRPLSDSIHVDTAAVPASLTAPLPASVDDAVKAAQEGRGDRQALSHLKSANRGGARIYNAMYLPSIGLSASIGTAGEKPEDLWDWDRRNWTAGVGLSWTLFDGMANRARARQYLSDAEKLRLSEEAVIKTIEIEIRTALSGCASADSNLEASRQMHLSAREAYELTSENFRQGGGQFSDLQLSEERLRQAELMVANARYRQVRSRAALRVAQGLDLISVEEK